MARTRLDNARRNIAVALAARAAALLSTFVTRTVIVSRLGAAYAGLSGLFSAVLQILSLAELGFGSAMVFSMYRPIAQGDVDGVCALLSLYRRIYRIIGLTVTGIGLLLLPVLPAMISGEVPPGAHLYGLYGINLANAALSYFLFAHESSLLAADQRGRLSSLLDAGATLCANLVQTLVLLQTRSFTLFFLVLPGITACKSLVTHRLVRRLYPQFVCRGQVPEKTLSGIRRRVSGLFIHRLCQVTRHSLDSVVISAHLGLMALTQYGNYYAVMAAVAEMTGAVTRALTASVGNALVTKSQAENYRDFQAIQLLYMWLCAVCTVCLFGLYQPFMRLWMGEGLMLGPGRMALFCAYFFTSRMGEVCYTYRQAAGLWGEDRVRPAAEAAGNLLLNVLLVRIIGMSGVLLSTILCLVGINAAWGSRILFRHCFTGERQSGYLLRLAYYAGATGLCCAVTGLCCARLAPGGAAGLVVRLAFCLAVPSLILPALLSRLPEFGDAMALARRALRKGA